MSLRHPHTTGSRSGASHGFQSEFVLATGTTGLRESFKAKNLGIVRVLTDRSEYAIAYLLRNDEDKQIRIGTCVPQGRARDQFGWSNRQAWQVIAISRNSIKEMQRLN